MIVMNFTLQRYEYLDATVLQRFLLTFVSGKTNVIRYTSHFLSWFFKIAVLQDYL